MGRMLPSPAMNAGADLHLFYLAWDASTDPNAVGYKIRATFQDGSTAPGSPKDVGNHLDGHFGVRRAGTYTFTIVSYNNSGDESTPTSSVDQTWTPGP